MGDVGQGSDGSTLGARARTLPALARAALELRPPMPFEKSRVRGQAPDRLTWDLGVCPGAPPLAEIGPAP